MRLSTHNNTASTPRPTTTASRRYFSIAASPMKSDPRKLGGMGRAICSGPQMSLMSSSPTIMPPMVMRICLRCWPYTGRTMTRSNARPSTAAAAMATSMVTKMAAKLSAIESAVAQACIPPITVVATKAPSAIKTPWPKLSTSIKPNTRVRPEAMMKTIMPMAKPATVSVSQVLVLPMKGRATAMRASNSSSGFTSNTDFTRVPLPVKPGTNPANAPAKPRRPPKQPSCRHAPRGRCPSPPRCHPAPWPS